MRIGGIQRFSLIDFPDLFAAVIFTCGCNFRCKYCHNPELVLPELYPPEIPLNEVMYFLEQRRGFLEGIVISGGEPLLQKDILNFISEIKNMGYMVKLDTNGSFPDVLEEVIKKKIVDYIAMDIKAPLNKYEEIIDTKVDTENILRSIKIIEESGIRYCFRTTLYPPYIKFSDLPDILTLISEKRYHIVQKFRHSGKILRDFYAHI